MVQGNFYFIKNDYFNKFLNENLSNNKSQVSGTADRPCIFAFEDKENSGLLWCVPISSKVSKYEKIYQDKMQSLGKCYTLEFGKILGSKRAFLIQNRILRKKDIPARSRLQGFCVSKVYIWGEKI